MISGEKKAGAKTVLVVDDHPILRQGLIQLLARQADLMVCGEADSISSATAAVERHRPDLLLLDLRLGSGDSLEFIKSLRRGYDDLHILIISQHDESIFAERCLRAGADGYVIKDEASEEVLIAIRTVLGGECYLSHRFAVRILQPPPELSRPEGSVSIASLSDRELYVFQLLGSGLSTREIATLGSLSVKTVESHRENIKHKLGLRDGDALVRRARSWVEASGCSIKTRIR